MDTQQQPEYTLEQIIESMFDFSDYSEEEKQEVIEETTGMITEAALLRGLDQAGKSVQDAFNDFLETEPNEEQMMEFIQTNIPDFEKLIAEEISLFDKMGDEEITEE
ncbi:MAG: hypothetical protein MRY57_04080 [Candidatus Pacebacteria bacterium]|nr:hypothetical protein [Candidatus Paceibacterota bacterium]